MGGGGGVLDIEMKEGRKDNKEDYQGRKEMNIKEGRKEDRKE